MSRMRDTRKSSFEDCVPLIRRSSLLFVAVPSNIVRFQKAVKGIDKGEEIKERNSIIFWGFLRGYVAGDWDTMTLDLTQKELQILVSMESL